MAGNTHLYPAGGDRNVAKCTYPRIGERIELGVGRARLASPGHEHALAGVAAPGALALISEHAHFRLEHRGRR